MNIAELNNHYLELWNNSGLDLPLRSLYSSEEKKKREEYLRNKLRKLPEIKNKLSGDNLHEKLFRSAQKSSALLLNINEKDLSVVFSDEFKTSSKLFVEESKRFDSTLTKNDISQAARNLWVINCLQVLFGYPVRLTQSAFAYSLLYPYCDNYLDDPLITKAQKYSFNSGLGLRLKGEQVTPSNEHEEKIFRLLLMIEEEFPRSIYPEVYEGLSSIHAAQCNSLKLFSKEELSCNDILKLSFEKGGTSVLADGYLVSGKLNELQRLFVYGLGIYLQIIDDLQDLNEDMNAALSTIFCHYAERGQLDQLTNKTLNFGVEIIRTADQFSNGESFRQLISESTNLLVIEAVCLSHRAYSRNYLRGLEQYSPFHFSFIKKYRKRLSANRISFLEMMNAGNMPA